MSAFDSTIAESLRKCTAVGSYREQEDSYSFDFTGVTLVHGETKDGESVSIPFFVFPKNYSLTRDSSKASESENLRDSARLLLKVLMRYNQNNFRKDDECYLAGGAASLSSEIEIAFRLIEDYRQRGIVQYFLNETKVLEKGKIKWPATIARVSPTISHRRPLYLSFVRERRFSEKESIISRLHRYAVTKAVQNWGWLTSVELSTEDFLGTLPLPMHLAVKLLRKELHGVYYQQDIDTLQLLIQFYEHSGKGQKEQIKLFGTQHFDRVWEDICKYVCGDQYPKLKDYLPQPVWHTIGYAAPKASVEKIGQIPDILTPDGECLMVLDAKYYPYTRRLPGWPDIVKQLFYVKTLELDEREEGLTKHFRFKRFYNAFLFPLLDSSSDLVRNLGYTEVNGCPSLGRVYAYGIHQYEAMKAYAFRNDSSICGILKERIRLDSKQSKNH